MDYVTSNFDRVAGVYDTLAHFVFRKDMRRAQFAFLDEIPTNANILVVGGGTGWLLAELLLRNPNCTVQYVDASSKMIELAEKTTSGLNDRVTFVHGTENDILPGSLFDAIITHFYLDLFDQDDLRRVVGCIKKSCRSGTLWLACDFVNNRKMHSVMLAFMYAFFRIYTNLKTRRLPDWNTAIQSAGFQEIRSRSFFHSFIRSAVFSLKSDD